MLLALATSVVNVLGLAISLWLGIYVVTRSPRAKVSWLAGASLWSLCISFFANVAYLHILLYGGLLPWSLGWGVVMAAPFWFHLTHSLRLSSRSASSRLLIASIYVLALGTLVMMTSTSWILAGASGRSPLVYSAQQPGRLFPLLALYLVIIPVFSLLNLCMAWDQASNLATRGWLSALLWATLLAALSGVYTATAVWAALDAPVVVSTVSLVAAIGLLGYGVARYNALIEGRLMRHDFSQRRSARPLWLLSTCWPRPCPVWSLVSP